ncbi:MAG: arsenate reductase (glutaredoxin) [Pasteurellaceae bacterium]|nr:arsenate reductase (glutaredoxin) [Pasteurellaceae bacterium]
MITLYHNPKCSKSRETLAILQENGVNVEIVEYLKTPLSAELITQLIDESGITIEQALRTDVDEYSQFIADKSLSKAEIIERMAAHPRLLNRPFARGREKTRFCRPPELVKELL